MSSLELVITNPPCQSVRARYLKEIKEGRGFITGANGKNVQLQVQNNIGKAWCFNGAKCTGEVKSLATQQTHGFYTLFNSGWDVTTEENGLVKVDLHHLAVVSNGGRDQKQKNDKGKFYLEFTLKLSENQLCPDLICRTGDMLDKSCKETCKPTIKRVNPQCAAGNEKIWVQCTSDVAKTKEVEAIFSGTIDGQELQFTVGCQVDGKLVEIAVPSLYDKFCIKDMAMLEMRLRVDKNDNIASDTVTFGYLPEHFGRPNLADSNNSVQKSRIQNMKTFDSDSLITCPSLNTDSGVVIGLIQPPNGVCNTSRHDFDRFEENSQHSRTFLDTKNPCLYEKEKNGAHQSMDMLSKVIRSTLLNEHVIKTVNDPTTSKPTSDEVILPNPIKSRIIPETNMLTEPQYDTEFLPLSTAIPGEEAQLYKGTLGWNIQVSSDKGKDSETLAASPKHDCNGGMIALAIEKEHDPEDISTTDDHLERQQTTDSKSAFNSHEQATNYFSLASNHNFETVTGTYTCLHGEEEVSPANLSVLTTQKDMENDQKCSASMASRYGHEYVPPSQSVISSNHNMDTGTGTCRMDVTEDFASSSVSVAEENVTDLQEYSIPLTTIHQSLPVTSDHSVLSPGHNLTTITSACATETHALENISAPVNEENTSQSCYGFPTFKIEGRQLVLNPVNDLHLYPSSIQLEPTHDDLFNESSEANYNAWMKQLSEQNIGRRDIFKDIKLEDADTTVDLRSISGQPVANSPDLNSDIHYEPIVKIRKLC